MATEVSPDVVAVHTLMHQTYCLQRLDINEGLDAVQLKTLWPFLFTADGINTHFEQLTGVPLMKTMKSAFERKVDNLMEYLKSSSKRCLPVAELIAEAKGELHNDTPSVVGLLLMLTAHFHEKEDGLLLLKDASWHCSRQLTFM